MKFVRKLASPLLLYTIVGVSVVLFLYRFSFARTIGFDMDELAYLNWASHLRQGYAPYIDFFLYTTPLYLLFLAPLFIFWNGIGPMIASRILAFGVFLALVGSTTMLFGLLRKRSWVLTLIPFLFVVLPLPSNKFFESRPDNLATVFGLLGLTGALLAFRRRDRRIALISGVAVALSVLTSQKGILFLIGPVALIISNWLKGKGNRVISLGIILGLFAPWLLFGLWSIATGQPDRVWYSVIVIPLEHARYERIFGYTADFFFRPNAFYYGSGGYSFGYLFNLAIWIIGLAVGAVRLITSFRTNPRTFRSEELAVALTFMAVLLFYVFGAPLKHTQYLIPVAVFVVFYIADVMDLLWHRAKQGAPFIVFIGLLTLLTWSGVRAFFSVNIPKLNSPSSIVLNNTSKLLEIIPPGSYVLDLEGRTLYYPYPYYVCCLSFGEFAPYLSRPLPSLSQALMDTKTRYIYQEYIDRIGALPIEDQNFIRVHYQPQLNNSLWVAKDW